MEGPAVKVDELMRRFAGLDLRQVAEAALVAQARTIANYARAARSGEDEVTTGGSTALIGWRRKELRRRERGWAGVAPEPVLASAAAVEGRRVTEVVGAAVAETLEGA